VHLRAKVTIDSLQCIGSRIWEIDWYKN